MNRGLLMMSEGYALLAQGIKELAMGEDVKPAKDSGNGSCTGEGDD